MKRRHRSKPSVKSGKKVGTIATAAARLFSSKGYIETSMEDIAAEAGLSKGGMYHYFGCKEEILYVILSDFMDFLLEGLLQEIQSLEDPTEKLRYLIVRHVRSYVSHTDSARALFNEAYNLSAPKLSKIKSKEKQYFSIMSVALSGYVEGRLDKDELTVVTFTLLGMCNWIYSWYDPQGAINPERLSQIIFENVTSGLTRFESTSLAAKGNARGAMASSTRPKVVNQHSGKK